MSTHTILLDQGAAQPTHSGDGGYVPSRVLLTGVGGFIAPYVGVQLLRVFPHVRVVGLDKMSYCSSMRNVEFTGAEAPERFQFVRADLTDLDALDALFREHRFDCVVHLAASTHVCLSFAHSLAFTRDNVVATHTLLEVARRHGVTRFTHVSTDECIGNRDDVADETVHSAPTNPYAATKVAAEAIVQSYYRSFRMPVLIARGSNAIGERQFPEKVIPKMILRLRAGLKCCVHGSGLQSRSFVHVWDIALGFVDVLRYGAPGEIYNVGCANEHSVLETIRALIALVHGEHVDPEQYIEYAPDRPFNDQRYLITSAKLHALTGWQPRVTFQDALRRTVQWYAENDATAYWPDSAVRAAVEEVHPTSTQLS